MRPASTGYNGAVRVFATSRLGFAWTLAALALTLSAEDLKKIDNPCSPEDAEALGLVCSEDAPCPVFLELSSVDGFGANIFVTGNLHTVDRTISGILLASDDAGKTWTEPAKRILAAELDQVQFADPQHGWASGVKVNSSLPRDPFILITANGGGMWHSISLFEEPILGSIEQFWFTSANKGQLLVDRSQGRTKLFELYETSTGGENWALKESASAPVAVAMPKAEMPNWRAIANGDAYRVERRNANGWETLASFAIRAGECK
jgi:hypothetical protein